MFNTSPSNNTLGRVMNPTESLRKSRASKFNFNRANTNNTPIQNSVNNSIQPAQINPPQINPQPINNQTFKFPTNNIPEGIGEIKSSNPMNISTPMQYSNPPLKEQPILSAYTSGDPVTNINPPNTTDTVNHYPPTVPTNINPVQQSVQSNPPLKEQPISNVYNSSSNNIPISNLNNDNIEPKYGDTRPGQSGPDTYTQNGWLTNANIHDPQYAGTADKNLDPNGPKMPYGYTPTTWTRAEQDKAAFNWNRSATAGMKRYPIQSGYSQ